MAAYFKLMNKQTEEYESFQEIDNKICAAFCKNPSEEMYFYFWYDIIGFQLAIGKTFEEIVNRESQSQDPDETLSWIAAWIRSHYICKNWFGY